MDEPEVLRCIWSGRSVARKPSEQLIPYFEKLLAAASEGAKKLEMRFEKLSHFNSSTIGTLIMLIQEARKKKVPLALIYDSSLKWQRLSFDALRMFEKGDNLFELRSV
jgi:hypothetical protein